jgi:branched-chain amino acid transport system substrate-binding protein
LKRRIALRKLQQQFLVFACLIAACQHVVAADKIKIGFLSTLSGQNGFIGSDARDAFALAVKLNGGKLGGLPVEFITGDDAQNPETGKQVADKLVKRDKVDIVTGLIFSNVLLAVAPQIFQSETFLLSPNAGPADLAGEKCNKYFFSVHYQNDNEAEAMGKYVTEKGFKNVYLMAPNYPSGKEHIAGFKRYYKGNVAGEVLTKLGQVDYAVEIAQIRLAKPDALFYMLPGGMGINFIKQAGQAGLPGELKLFAPGSTLDDDILGAVGDVVEGVYNTSHWAKDFDNPQNKKFVAEFEKEYKRPPTGYASTAYDTALLIDAAVAEVKGKIEDKAALGKAFEKANFKAVRGAFKFAPNHFPIQTFYLRQVVKDSQGKLTNKSLGPILTDHRDVYGASCKL